MPDIQLIIRTIAEGTGDKDLQAGLKDLNGAIGVVRSSYQVMNQIYSETIGKTVTYANEVRGLSMVTGKNADETSRLIQVADDYKIGVDALTMAHRNLNKNGMSLSIDTLATLSDKYKTLNSGQERTEFLMQNFGARGGLAFAEIMSKGGDAIKQQSAAIESGLILDEKKLQAARNLEMSQDALNDKFQALSLTVGTAAVPAFTAWVDLINKATTSQEFLAKIGGDLAALYVGNFIPLAKDYGDILNQNKAELDAAAVSTDKFTASNEDLAAAQKEVSDMNQAMIGTINSMQSAEDSYTQKSTSLTADRKAAEADLAKFREQGYWEQSDQIQGALKKIDEIKAKEADLEKERARQTLQFISNILEERLARDGWTKEEFDAFAKQQVAWGLWSEDAQKNAAAAFASVDKIVQKIGEIQPKDVDINVNYNYSSNGTEGGTDGDPSTPRDSGGPGKAGKSYLIGRGAQPEIFIPNTDGTFIPNADRLMNKQSSQPMQPAQDTKSSADSGDILRLLNTIANNTDPDRQARAMRDYSLQDAK